MSLACLTANQMSFIDNFVGKEQFAGWPPSDAKWSPNRGMPFEGSGELSMRNYYCRLDGMFADIDINVIKKVKQDRKFETARRVWMPLKCYQRHSMVK